MKRLLWLAALLPLTAHGQTPDRTAYPASVQSKMAIVNPTGQIMGDSTNPLVMQCIGCAGGSNLAIGTTAGTARDAAAAISAETAAQATANGALSASSAGPLATQAGASPSAAVIAALGFTPYNATNPSGYVTASTAPVQSVAGITGAPTATQLNAVLQPTAASIPTGAGTQGQRVLNSAPTVQGSTGAQYVTIGWICTATGTPGTWAPMNVFTGS